jgi:prepilin-type N-terminal cleavage/methylation domain-containing protein
MKINKIKIVNGFTLVELLVVIAIIGILTTIASASYAGVQKKARDAERKSNLHALSNALVMYFNDNGVFPALTSEQIFGTGLTGASGVVYMKETPIDPKEGTRNFTYVYKYSADQKEFNLFANLENTNDPQCSGHHYTITGIGATFCYGISGPNTVVRNW